eukprot:PhM_4_TR3337/c0_g1_i1/m.84114
MCYFFFCISLLCDEGQRAVRDAIKQERVVHRHTLACEDLRDLLRNDAADDSCDGRQLDRTPTHELLQVLGVALTAGQLREGGNVISGHSVVALSREATVPCAEVFDGPTRDVPGVQLGARQIGRGTRLELLLQRAVLNGTDVLTVLAEGPGHCKRHVGHQGAGDRMDFVRVLSGLLCVDLLEGQVRRGVAVHVGDLGAHRQHLVSIVEIANSAYECPKGCVRCFGLWPREELPQVGAKHRRDRVVRNIELGLAVVLALGLLPLGEFLRQSFALGEGWERVLSGRGTLRGPPLLDRPVHEDGPRHCVVLIGLRDLERVLVTVEKLPQRREGAVEAEVDLGPVGERLDDRLLWELKA